jgi:hypothetical protein
MLNALGPAPGAFSFQSARLTGRGSMTQGRAMKENAEKTGKAAQPEVAEAEETVIHATASPPYHVKGEVVDGEGPQVPERAPPDPATWMHQRLVHQIIEFEKHLGADLELGGRFVGGPANEPLHISNVASWGPDMIVFMGQYSDGRKFELLQHYSQVSVLLVAIPKLKDEPRRIGFELLKNVKELPHPWGDPVS